MKYASLLAGLLVLVSTVEQVQGQALPASRNHIAGWHNAGFPGEPWAPDRIVNVRDFGALGNGVANDLPGIQAAMNSLGSEGGVVYFPAGIYNIPDNSLDLNANIVLRGERSSTTEIRITNHVAGQFHAIKISGTTSGGWITVNSGYDKFSQTLSVSDISGFSAGDYAQIRMGTNVAWKMSSWAQNSIGQIVRIQSVNTTVAPAGTITLVTPLRQQFYPNQQIDGVPVPVGIQKILPKKNVGIENLKIGRTVSSSGSGNDNAFTIWFNYATECWVRGCEISNFLGAAIACEYSANNKFSGNFIDSPFEVDGGGSGYGITYQFRSSENLAENNIFRKNRHSMVVQIGANGNVFGWNYSREQKRTEYPSSAAQDTIIHGNWAGANLFEGNCAANNTIDASSGHGINAPDNFLFRNRYRQSGVGCGMYWTDSSANQSFIGNEIVGTISINKTGKFEYGDLKGTTATPAGFTTLADVSYYWGTNVFSPPVPGWWNIANNPPTIGLPFNVNTANEYDIPARSRWNSGAPYTYAPPSISGQPASVTITAGASAMFAVVAAGTPTVQYKWYKNGVEIPGAVSASFAIASAQPADAGQYKALVSDARGSMFSATATLTVNGAPLPPAAPSGLTAGAVSISQINLSWADNSANETGFMIERSLTSGSGYTQIATLGVNVTSFQDTGLTAGTVYFYRVRATNGSGNSGYSNEANATTQAAGGQTLADSVNELSATQGQNNWYYGYYDKPSSASFIQDVWDGANARWAGAEAWCLLWADGGHPGSTDWSVRRWVAETSGAIHITGTLAKSDVNGGNGIIGRILVNGVEQWAQAISYNDAVGVNYALDLSVSAGDSIDFAIDPNGEYTCDGSKFSAVITLGGGQPVLPAAPSSLTASVASSSQINLSWADNANNETGYKIERSLTSGSGFAQIATVGANVTTYQDTGVSAGTAYYYRVRATNAGGDSSYSSEATATTASAGTGLVAHWKLDETSGTTAADFSGYGNSGTLVNGPTWGAGVVGGAVQLSAGSQYIVANNVAVNTAGGGCNTVAFWMKWDGTENQMPFGWNGLYDLWFYGGAFGINTAQSDIFGIASTGLAGQWVHVAVVFPNGAPSAANAKIYINGILQAAAQQLGSSTSRSATPGVLISGWGNDGNYKFGGAIDDVRIYDHELTAAEVVALASINGLPSPWAAQDIGAVGVAGSASHAGGVYTINGSGADIWSTADGFQYVYQIGSGDCDVRARVTAVGNTDPWAKAGVMIRDGLSASAMFADMVMTPGTGGSSFQYRVTTGADCGYAQNGGISTPYWVRVVRSGNDFTGYMSPDGAAWTQVGGTQTIAMGATTYIGLAVTAHNNASLCTATIDNVTVAP